MAMSHPSDIVKQGPVRVKCNHILGGIFNRWRKTWLVLLRRSSRGAIRLAIYKTLNVPNPDSTPKRVYELTNCAFVSPVPSSIRQFCIAITFVDCKLFQFCLDSDAAFESWFQCLRTTCDRFLSLAGSYPQNPEYFCVCLLPSAFLPFRGECLMQVTSNTLKIFDVDNNHQRMPIAEWPLQTIRQFGNPKDDRFTFIAGSSSPYGESMFVFTTTEAPMICTRIRTVTQARVDEQRINGRSQLNNVDLLSTPRGSGSSRSAIPDMLVTSPNYFATDQYSYTEQWRHVSRREPTATNSGGSPPFGARY